MLFRFAYEAVLYYLQSKLIHEGVISGVAGTIYNITNMLTYFLADLTIHQNHQIEND